MKPNGGELPTLGAPEAIVIGGSAGAIEALLRLLPGLPAAMTLPIVVVVHLPHQKPSILVDVLGRKLDRPVREPQDKEPIAPSVVYIAPPDYHLLIDEGPTFAFSVDKPVNYSQPSIDVLFETAADVLGPHLVGILLSGASADGAVGLKAILDAQGLAIIQAPAECSSSVMPRAAMATCPAAHVLPLARIRSCLHEFRRVDTSMRQGTP